MFKYLASSLACLAALIISISIQDYLAAFTSFGGFAGFLLCYFCKKEAMKKRALVTYKYFNIKTWEYVGAVESLWYDKEQIDNEDYLKRVKGLKDPNMILCVEVYWLANIPI